MSAYARSALYGGSVFGNKVVHSKGDSNEPRSVNAMGHNYANEGRGKNETRPEFMDPYPRNMWRRHARAPQTLLSQPSPHLSQQGPFRPRQIDQHTTVEEIENSDEDEDQVSFAQQRTYAPQQSSQAQDGSETQLMHNFPEFLHPQSSTANQTHSSKSQNQEQPQQLQQIYSSQQFSKKQSQSITGTLAACSTSLHDATYTNKLESYSSNPKPSDGQHILSQKCLHSQKSLTEIRKNILSKHAQGFESEGIYPVVEETPCENCDTTQPIQSNDLKRSSSRPSDKKLNAGDYRSRIPLFLSQQSNASTRHDVPSEGRSSRPWMKSIEILCSRARSTQPAPTPGIGLSNTNASQAFQKHVIKPWMKSYRSTSNMLTNTANAVVQNLTRSAGVSALQFCRENKTENSTKEMNPQAKRMPGYGQLKITSIKALSRKNTNNKEEDSCMGSLKFNALPRMAKDSDLNEDIDELEDICSKDKESHKDKNDYPENENPEERILETPRPYKKHRLSDRLGSSKMADQCHGNTNLECLEVLQERNLQKNVIENTSTEMKCSDLSESKSTSPSAKKKVANRDEFDGKIDHKSRQDHLSGIRSSNSIVQDVVNSDDLKILIRKAIEEAKFEWINSIKNMIIEDIKDIVCDTIQSATKGDMKPLWSVNEKQIEKTIDLTSKAEVDMVTLKNDDSELTRRKLGQEQSLDKSYKKYDEVDSRSFNFLEGSSISDDVPVKEIPFKNADNIECSDISSVTDPFADEGRNFGDNQDWFDLSAQQSEKNSKVLNEKERSQRKKKVQKKQKPREHLETKYNDSTESRSKSVPSKEKHKPTIDVQSGEIKNNKSSKRFALTQECNIKTASKQNESNEDINNSESILETPFRRSIVQTRAKLYGQDSDLPGAGKLSNTITPLVVLSEDKTKSLETYKKRNTNLGEDFTVKEATKAGLNAGLVDNSETDIKNHSRHRRKNIHRLTQTENTEPRRRSCRLIQNSGGDVKRPSTKTTTLGTSDRFIRENPNSSQPTLKANSSTKGDCNRRETNELKNSVMKLSAIGRTKDSAKSKGKRKRKDADEGEFFCSGPNAVLSDKASTSKSVNRIPVVSSDTTKNKASLHEPNDKIPEKTICDPSTCSGTATYNRTRGRSYKRKRTSGFIKSFFDSVFDFGAK